MCVPFWQKPKGPGKPKLQTIDPKTDFNMPNDFSQQVKRAHNRESNDGSGHSAATVVAHNNRHAGDFSRLSWLTGATRRLPTSTHMHPKQKSAGGSVRASTRPISGPQLRRSPELSSPIDGSNYSSVEFNVSPLPQDSSHKNVKTALSAPARAAVRKGSSGVSWPVALNTSNGIEIYHTHRTDTARDRRVGAEDTSANSIWHNAASAGTQRKGDAVSHEKMTRRTKKKTKRRKKVVDGSKNWQKVVANGAAAMARLEDVRFFSRQPWLHACVLQRARKLL